LLNVSVEKVSLSVDKHGSESELGDFLQWNSVTLKVKKIFPSVEIHSSRITWLDRYTDVTYT
jgi:hypothetical protein